MWTNTVNREYLRPHRDGREQAQMGRRCVHKMNGKQNRAKVVVVYPMKRRSAVPLHQPGMEKQHLFRGYGWDPSPALLKSDKYLGRHPRRPMNSATYWKNYCFSHDSTMQFRASCAEGLARELGKGDGMKLWTGSPLWCSACND